MKKKKTESQGKFPADVARFFNPHKSGTNAFYAPNGMLVRPGTHQSEKMKESSYIPVRTMNKKQKV